MAGELETVRIENPDNRDDYIVIAKNDFDPEAHVLFTAEVAVPATPSEPPPEDPRNLLIDQALDTTVSNLGPWLNAQDDVELLSRLLVEEQRTSAIALIKSRITALQ